MVHMSAPCPPWLKEAWITWLGPERVHELYGGTEGLSYTWITGTRVAHPPRLGGQTRPAGRCKSAMPRATWSPGAVGEIYMSRTRGRGPRTTTLGRSPGGWTAGNPWRPGWMDAEGYLYLADRRTDLTLRGGANIYPAEVEAALDAHPRVRSSAVIGLPHEDLGQRVHAIVDAPGGVTDTELLAHLADRLVRSKIRRASSMSQNRYGTTMGRSGGRPAGPAACRPRARRRPISAGVRLLGLTPCGSPHERLHRCRRGHRTAATQRPILAQA